LGSDLRVPYDASVTVDHESPAPLDRQVAGILRGRVESGELTSRLPSLKTIAQTYGVSHVTAEKAIALLRDEGLVIVVVGRGAYVKKGS
jgi:DNA-binding GntR family transcriptional regulator